MKQCHLVIITVALVIVTSLFYANWTYEPLHPGGKADQVVIEKASSRLLVFYHGELLLNYPVALGSSPFGPKTLERDNKTPEKNYVIDWRNSQSGYHLPLHISYPSVMDVSCAKSGGYPPGGAIMIHGIKSGFGWIGRFHRVFNWNRGCIALTNPEINELWKIVPNGTLIRIDP